MLKINILLKEKKVKKIEFKGHADYNEEGLDIVCAAASSILITGVNGVLSLFSQSIDYKESQDLVVVDVLLNNENIDKLIASMITLLENLEKDYPSNVKLYKEEDHD